jgi:hypothetical protein
MKAAGIYSYNCLFGVPEEGITLELPEYAMGARVRLRQAEYAMVFVKYADRIQAHYIDVVQGKDGPIFIVGAMIGKNQTI